MGIPGEDEQLGRMSRRKAATRASVLRAADALFAERGYDATSMEAIAEAADVAVRTIYLHFPSKAAILLAYFNDWLREFVRLTRARPITEPVAVTIEHVLSEMIREGWVDHGATGDPVTHPFVTMLTTGPNEIAGHVMQCWLAAQSELAAGFGAAAPAGQDPLRPWARASAIFTAWTATMLASTVNDGKESGSGNELGVAIVRRLARDDI